jgi:hypothetical protein
MTTSQTQAQGPTSSSSTFLSSSTRQALLWAGLTAGLLDASAGVLVYYIWFGFNPFQVLQYIAEGAFGPDAMTGGFPMVLAGLGLHFFIAYVAAGVYLLVYARLQVLGQYAVVSGLLYGAAIWASMNLLVIPNSNIPPAPFDPGLAIVGIIWHMVLVGLPIALIAKKYLGK